MRQALTLAGFVLASGLCACDIPDQAEPTPTTVASTLATVPITAAVVYVTPTTTPPPWCAPTYAEGAALSAQIDAHFAAHHRQWACAIAICESDVRMDAVGEYGERGWFQIHVKVWRHELDEAGIDPLTPDGNARAAAYILGRQGATAWTCNEDVEVEP